MASISPNQKYVLLEGFRVSHRPQDDSIHLTSTDPDFPEGFHLPLAKGTHVEQQLRAILIEHQLVKEPGDSNGDSTDQKEGNLCFTSYSAEEYVTWIKSFIPSKLKVEKTGSDEIMISCNQKRIVIFLQKLPLDSSSAYTPQRSVFDSLKHRMEELTLQNGSIKWTFVICDNTQPELVVYRNRDWYTSLGYVVEHSRLKSFIEEKINW